MISEYVGVGVGAVSPLSILYLPRPWNLSGCLSAGAYPLPFWVRMCKQHRLFLRLQKFECPDEQRNIVPVNWAVITQAQFFEDDARHEQAFDAFLDLMREVHAGFPKNRLDEIASFIVQMRISRIRRRCYLGN